MTFLMNFYAPAPKNFMVIAENWGFFIEHLLSKSVPTSVENNHDDQHFLDDE